MLVMMTELKLQYHQRYRAKNRIKLNAYSRERYQKKSKEERCIAANKYRLKHPESEYNTYLKRRYGVSREGYNRLFESQNGCCAICGRHQSEMKKRLSLDHNHETGKNRALLCNKCNVAIGLFYEDPSILEAALEYLQKWNKSQRSIMNA